MITFTPAYSRSLIVQLSAEMRASMLVTRKAALGMIGLCAGDFHVMMMKGIAAVVDAATDRTSAHFDPFVSQSAMHKPTRAAITLSNPDHPYLPLKRSTIVVAVAPAP